jgi:hypothetical protein
MPSGGKGNGETKALRELYTENEYAKAILDDFAGRTNRQSTTGVDQIMSRLRTAELPKWAVVKLFRRLGELGYGRFVVGRRGKESRFVWSANPIEVGKSAQGEDLAITSLPEPEAAEVEMVMHQFNLRPEMPVKIELPADFTEREAERFSQFLRSLPFSDN